MFRRNKRCKAEEFFAPPLFLLRLLSQTELFDNGTVTVNILLLKIVEKVSSVTDHLQQTASGVMVVVVVAQMLGERVDTGGRANRYHPHGYDTVR